jgi:hypothetical protein
MLKIFFKIVTCVPCHHGIARFLSSDGVDGLQMWRVAESKVNERSRTADRGWFSKFGDVCERLAPVTRWPEGKRPLIKSERRGENNIKIDLKVLDWEDMDWTYMA